MGAIIDGMGSLGAATGPLIAGVASDESVSVVWNLNRTSLLLFFPGLG